MYNNSKFEFSCNACGKELHLDDKVVSRSGKRIPLELNGNTHDCPKKEPWVSDFFKCRDCNADLYVTDSELSPNGIRIPLNADDDKPHKCANRSTSFACRECAMMIYVDPRRLSKNGKKIPIDAETNQPHQCSKIRRINR
jgi:hypothetical protein